MVGPTHELSDRHVRSVKLVAGNADVIFVTDKSRCPACGSGVPAGAVWCSLCFQDLRSGVPVAAGHAAAQDHIRAAVRPDPPVTGRPVTARPVTGRHSADSPRPRPEATEPSTDSQLTFAQHIPAETERWADQVLTQLRRSESAMPDPESAPGGKWGVAALGTALVITALLVVYTLLGFFIGR